MIIFVVEIALILILVLIYLRKELAIDIRDFRHGDVIWVRHQSLKPQRAVLSKWNNSTFCYMVEDSYELNFKRWYFLARNESYAAREKQENSFWHFLNIKFTKLRPVAEQQGRVTS